MKITLSPSKPKHNPGSLLALGAGIAALATASYYFFGPKGEEHRDDLKGWMIKMKGEIIDRIEDVKELTEPIYRDIIDSVVAGYAATTKVGKEEIRAFADRLKDQWRDIVKSSEIEAEVDVEATKKAAKRAVKKAASKIKSKRK